jgi:uncharacterized SAM-binding protein YcdF (DUF218 family)
VTKIAVFEYLRERTSGRTGRILRITLLSLLIWSLLAWIAARGLIVSAELNHADALVVLAGSSAYLERTGWAAQLFKEGRAPKIILTNDNIQAGWSVSEQRNPLFVELAAEELRRKDVPGENIEVIPEIASSTYEEARRLRGYAVEHNLRSILVVTSPYHSRRALWTLRRVFEGSGIEIGLDTPQAGEQTPSPASWWFYPMGWKMVAGEYLKLIYYKVRY